MKLNLRYEKLNTSVALMKHSVSNICPPGNVGERMGNELKNESEQTEVENELNQISYKDKNKKGKKTSYVRSSESKVVVMF